MCIISYIQYIFKTSSRKIFFGLGPCITLLHFVYKYVASDDLAKRPLFSIAVENSLCIPQRASD